MRLSASDGALLTADTVQISVLVGPNVAPVVDAGPNRTITLPAGAALDGTVSDDGLPNPPGAVTTTWSMGSGPGAVTFQNGSQVDTQASFTLAGTYMLRLTANDGALYNYRVGNDDELKFRKNQRTGLEIIHETFGLDYAQDEYTFALTEEERRFVVEYKREIGHDPRKTYVGLNTGCSILFPNKKLTVEQHVSLINAMTIDDRLVMALLGGREDTERNEQILNALAPAVRRKVVATPTTAGLRKGACFIDCCDIVVTGDSFGMHLSIALRKYVIAWFGLSCWSEIELYGRGEKLIPEGLECAPCWKKQCPYNLECIAMVDLAKITALVRRYADGHRVSQPRTPQP